MASLDELLARLRARAADPDRRVDVRQNLFTADVTSLDLGGLLGRLGQVSTDVRRVVTDNQAGRVNPELMAKAEAVEAAMTSPVPTELPAPATTADIARAEANLGFAFPDDLRRVYLEVADGGFGPGSGLLSLKDIVLAHAHLRSGEILPRGRAWPDRLVPVVAFDPGFDCVDAATAEGRVVTWDPDDLSERPGDKAWSRSFRDVAPSVERWLGDWVGSKTQSETMQELMHQSMIDSVRQSRAYFAAMTPEERAAYGLPGEGWEREIGGHLGLDEDEIRGDR